MKKENKTKEMLGTVIEPNGRPVRTDVSLGAYLRRIEDKAGAKWVRNGSDKDPKGAPID